MEILPFISFSIELFPFTIDHRYLNDFTCSRWVWVMSIPSILCCFFVHLMYFVLCSFMVNRTCNDISFSFWKVSSRACIVLVVPVDMLPFKSSCFITLSIKILNKVADRRSPRLTPETILNSFVNWLPIFTFDLHTHTHTHTHTHIYIYIYIYCAFVGPDCKRHKLHS